MSSSFGLVPSPFNSLFSLWWVEFNIHWKSFSTSSLCQFKKSELNMHGPEETFYHTVNDTCINKYALCVINSFMLEPRTSNLNVSQKLCLWICITKTSIVCGTLCFFIYYYFHFQQLQPDIPHCKETAGESRSTLITGLLTFSGPVGGGGALISRQTLLSWSLWYCEIVTEWDLLLWLC